MYSERQMGLWLHTQMQPYPPKQTCKSVWIGRTASTSCSSTQVPALRHHSWPPSPYKRLSCQSCSPSLHLLLIFWSFRPHVLYLYVDSDRAHIMHDMHATWTANVGCLACTLFLAYRVVS